MYVKHILQAKGHAVVTVSPSASIGEALDTLARHDIGALLVSDETDEQGGRVCGVLSERDLVRAMASQREACLLGTVAALMTEDVISCGPDDSIDSVMALMTERRVRHLPVLEDGQLVGLISIGDVVKHRMEEVQREASAMRDYISAVV